MTGNGENCCCCSGPCYPRESFIGKETVWTGWHRRPPPRDPWDIRDKCALRCAVDPEKKKEACTVVTSTAGGQLKSIKTPGFCQEPPYPRDIDPQVSLIKKRLAEGKNVSTEEVLQFANTATGVVGKRRESMLTNRLLRRHSIGNPLNCCYDLPDVNFRYGFPNVPGWKASDALRGWKGTGLVEPSRQMVKKAPKNLCCTDILALNRAAINAGIVSAPDFRVYRNTHCLKFSRHARRGAERLPPREVDKNMIYGKKSNYVTTMKELLSDQEFKEWEQCIQGCMKEQMVVKKANKPDKWKENQACWLRTAHSVKGPQMESLWQMPRFLSKAKPHLCTFRSDDALVAAHKANGLERVGRDGFFGEGITTRAVNKIDPIYTTKD